MAIYVSLEEAAVRLEELADAALTGEEVIIVDKGVPQVRLEAYCEMPAERDPFARPST
jgi:antitoxin (DNA-binding transcriptional repressor) of toxin-antitoxin stability system